MNAIILAAGEGKRLRPLTNDRPKCLIEFCGKTLLERQIEIFNKCGIDEICVVTGYNSHMFKDKNLEYINNSNFATTNMLKSLFCAEEKISKSTIVSYGDIVFEESVLIKLINSMDDFSIIIDKNWKNIWELRFDNPINDAESLILNEQNYITEIGKKVEDITKINGQYIGLMKFQNEAVKKIKSYFEKCEKTYDDDKINLLNSKNSFNNSYMTEFLQGLIDEGEKLKAINIQNGWLEFDNINDYDLYNELKIQNKIGRFFDLND